MHTLKLTFMTLALALVFGNSSNAFAEVYRWKDSNGQVHFSDQPISTDPKVVTEVEVARPNVLQAFKASVSAVAEPSKKEGRPSAPTNQAAPEKPKRGGDTAKMGPSE